MVAAVLLLLSAAVPDTGGVFADSSTATLVRRAQARHAAGEAVVRDYTARLDFRAGFQVGRRLWQEAPTLWALEVVSRVHWQAPDDLRIDIEGARQARRLAFEPEVEMSRPWFVPRQLGDSIRVLYADYPAVPALHPLAASGPDSYRYAIADSLAIALPDGRVRRATLVEVRPRRVGPSLVTGRLWLDAETADVVRFTFRFVGTALRRLPADAGREPLAERSRIGRFADRFQYLDADLEYALQEGGVWMPHRQTLAGAFRFSLSGDLYVPFQATTRFRDYVLNGGVPLALGDGLVAPEPGGAPFAVRTDSGGARTVVGRTGAGRYALVRPSRDSLARYADWAAPMALEPDAAERARVRELREAVAPMADALPHRMTPQPGFGWHLGAGTVLEAFRYNRVQGLAPGTSVRLRVPGLPATTARVAARVGLSDERPTGLLEVQHDAPAGRVALTAFRTMVDADPFSGGLNLGNSLRSLATARDEADYFLGTGALATWTTSLRPGLEFVAGVEVERQRSVATAARSALNDWFGGTGDFRPNPAVRDGWYVQPFVSAGGVAPWGSVALGARVLAGEGQATLRATASTAATAPVLGGATLRLKVGATSRDLLPQAQFRAGGLNSVRGHAYATQVGPAFWATQLDVALLRGPVRPVLFADAGQAMAWGAVGEAPVLAGGGVGLSLLGGTLRLDLSHPITRRGGRDWQVDLILFAVR